MFEPLASYKVCIECLIYYEYCGTEENVRRDTVTEKYLVVTNIADSQMKRPCLPINHFIFSDMLSLAFPLRYPLISSVYHQGLLIALPEYKMKRVLWELVGIKKSDLSSLRRAVARKAHFIEL